MSEYNFTAAVIPPDWPFGDDTDQLTALIPCNRCNATRIILARRPDGWNDWAVCPDCQDDCAEARLKLTDGTS